MKQHILCLVLSLALILSMAGCNATEPAETEVPTTSTTSAPTETQPVQTQATEVIPTETVPATTAPPETEPTVTEPPATEPTATEPSATEPSVTQPAPTTPPTTEPAQVEYECGDHYVRILNYTPGPNEHSHLYWGPGGNRRVYEGEYIFDVDYRTVTYELWCSWDAVVQLIFRNSIECDICSDVQMTPDESYYYRRIVENDNYTCGYENHYCAKETNHIYLLRWMAEGCKFCGKTDCVSFLARDEQGFTNPDGTLCPEYDVHRDSWFYCQECHMPTWQTIQDVTKCCHSYIRSVNCHECGVWVEARACHTCKQEDIDAFKATQGG